MIIGLTFIYNIRRSLGPRQWFAAAFVFTIGSLPIIASTVRYTTVYYILRDPFTSFTRVREIEMWSEIDAAFTTYAACLPALRSLIRETRDKGTGSADGYGKENTGSVVTKRKRISETEMDRTFDEDMESGLGEVVVLKEHRGHVRGESSNLWDIYVTTEFEVEVDEGRGVPTSRVTNTCHAH